MRVSWSTSNRYDGDVYVEVDRCGQKTRRSIDPNHPMCKTTNYLKIVQNDYGQLFRHRKR